MTQAMALMLPQIGVETVEGTAVAATKKLGALSIEPNFDVDIGSFTAYGTKVPGLVFNNRSDRMSANVTGQPTYTEMIYPLAGIIANPTPTQPDDSGAPNTYLWTFTPDVDGADTIATYTTEIVGTDRSYRFANGIFNTLNFTIARSSGGGQVSMGGSMFGAAMEDGVTPTASLSGVDLIPMTPLDFCIYIDDTAANLGTTKFDEGFQVAFSIPARFMPYESIDCENDTFAGHFEGQYAPTLALTFERNADASGLITSMRDNTKKFIRIEGTGPNIESTFDHKFTIDFCGIIQTAGMGNQDQLATVNYTFLNVNDVTWGKSFEVSLQNGLASL